MKYAELKERVLRNLSNADEDELDMLVTEAERQRDAHALVYALLARLKRVCVQHWREHLDTLLGHGLQPPEVMEAWQRVLSEGRVIVQEFGEGEWDVYLLQVPPRMSKEQLRLFVLDYLGGRIFTLYHIPIHAQQHVAPSVFLPLALGAGTRLDAETVGCIYEYVDKALPRGINGYPCFGTFRIMHTGDWKRCVKVIGQELDRREKIQV